MINSNTRKLCLSGWLKKYSETEYNTPLKLQKYLLLYESFSKISGEKPDFGHLRGYAKGPVFSDVWGDYTKERGAFNHAVEKAFHNAPDSINVSRAKKSAFIVKTLTEKELSELTHKMNIWKSKETQIMSGERQVSLREEDFNEEDTAMMKLLDSMYSDDMINNSEVINLDRNYFVFSKADMPKLTEEHFDVLLSLTEQEELENPVYVEMDEEGRLLID
jgi:hypothetical protein